MAGSIILSVKMDADYNKNVFINCPYDREYIPIKHAIIFAVSICGFIPNLVSMNHDGATPRIDKIKAMIKASKYGIHDISRCKAKRKGEFYRLNMPFELGMDLGCRYFSNEHNEKNLLVLSASPYNHQPSLSDYSGYDPKCHKNNLYQVIYIIREFFYGVIPIDQREAYIKKSEVKSQYERFQTTLYTDLGGVKEEVNQLTDLEYYTKVYEYLKLM